VIPSVRAGQRQGESEGGPRAGLALRRDASPMSQHDLAADRQSYAGAFVFVQSMQPLERFEDLFTIRNCPGS
jgi:hypothetical protein